MRAIKTVLFDPVGTLAEFFAREFSDISAEVFNARPDAAASGSAAYWHLLDLMEQSGTLNPVPREIAERLELQAVERVQLYEDVIPALEELQAMGIWLAVASSLSTAGITRFLDRFSLHHFFSAVWSRDTAGGVKSAPLARALAEAPWEPGEAMVLVDTAASVAAAKEVGANSILMINDHDEGQRLAMEAPAGGIVSLHELPYAIRLVAENAKPASRRC